MSIGFCPALLHFFIDESDCGGVVDCYWGGWLWVAHFFQCDSDWNAFFAVDKCSSNLRVGSQGGHMFEDMGWVQDCAVVNVRAVACVA